MSTPAEHAPGKTRPENRVLLAIVVICEACTLLAGALANMFRPNSGDRGERSGDLGPKTSCRSEDRRLEPQHDTPSHHAWGTFVVLWVFLAAIAGAVGFLYIYWTGGNNLLLGGTLAISLGALGVAFVLYSHWLMPHKQAIEPREHLPSDAGTRQAVLDTFREVQVDVHRRSLLAWIGVVGVGMISAIIVSMMRSIGASPEPSLSDTIWKRGQRLMTMDGTPVSVDALQPGNFMVVFPEESIGDEKAQTMLLRVKPELLQLPGERAGWAPMGYVAYSRVCTHAGCPVGLFETTTDLLLCPCHQSTFDILRGAQPTSGPAARALPQLPLYADSDGTLRAGGPFTEPPGPGFWSIS